MHVVQVLPELNVGGVERGTLQIAAALVAAGHRSTVISAGGALVGELTGGGTRHVEMPVHAKSLSVLSQIAPLRNTLSALRPDVVHVRSRLPAWLVRFAMKRLPVDARPHLVTTVHGLYGVHPYSAIMTRGDRVIAISRAVLDYITANYPRVDVDVIRLVHRG
ncbi:MAG: glycosyltransferase, partial [Gammaproteobacteria bacterium]|nr:glycosyltransferase [Gammaproteobacteria bacterium]